MSKGTYVRINKITIPSLSAPFYTKIPSESNTDVIAALDFAPGLASEIFLNLLLTSLSPRCLLQTVWMNGSHCEEKGKLAFYHKVLVSLFASFHYEANFVP